MFRQMTIATLSAAFIASTFSVQLYANKEKKEVNFCFDLKQKIKKMLNAKEKSPSKMFDYAREIKRHVERNHKSKFFVLDYLDWACEIIKDKKGVEISEESHAFFQKSFNAKSDFFAKAPEITVEIKEVKKEEVYGMCLIMCGLYVNSHQNDVCNVWGLKLIEAGLEHFNSSL